MKTVICISNYLKIDQQEEIIGKFNSIEEANEFIKSEILSDKDFGIVGNKYVMR